MICPECLGYGLIWKNKVEVPCPNCATPEPRAQKTIVRLSAVPPSVNQIWRHTRSRTNGKPVTYRSERYNTWRNSAAWEAKAQAVKQPKWDSPVYVTIAMRRPRLNADIDNRLKGILDLLQHVGIIADDKLVHGINAYWSANVEGCEISITAADPLSEAA